MPVRDGVLVVLALCVALGEPLCVTLGVPEPVELCVRVRDCDCDAVPEEEGVDDSEPVCDCDAV